MANSRFVHEEAQFIVDPLLDRNSETSATTLVLTSRGPAERRSFTSRAAAWRTLQRRQCSGKKCSKDAVIVV